MNRVQGPCLLRSLDELTGAYLRGPGLLQAESDLSRAKREQTPFVAAFVDVARLKRVNDRDGHAAGDGLLRRVVVALRTKLRSHDQVVRYGGDEFVCFVAGLALVNVTHRLDDVNALLADGHVRGSVTAGLAQWQPEETVDELLARADAELYRLREYRGPGRD